jgi:hypothetical protein
MAGSPASRVLDWLRDRLPIDAAAEFASHKRVPHY